MKAINIRHGVTLQALSHWSWRKRSFSRYLAKLLDLVF